MSKNSGGVRVIDEKTSLFVIAGPMFLELLLNILLNNMDTLMLSHYNEYSVGAVGNANQVMFLFIIMFNIIATAISVVVAQYLGAKKYDEMNKIYTLAFIVNMVFGIVLSAFLVLGKGLITTFLNVSPQMLPDACTYLNIVGGGLFLQAGYNVMLQILRCNGYTKIGMYISIAINLINIGGNYLFLYGPLKHLDLGVAGVGISTVTARVIALIFALAFFYRKKIGKMSLKLLHPFPGNLLAKMIKIGLPSAGENFAYSFYQMILLSFINTMGDDSVNARVYCNSLISFSWILANASAMATQIITGHLVGAGKEEEAYKRVFKTLKLTLPLTIAVSAANWLLSPFTLRIFTANETIIKVGFAIMAVDVFLETGRCLNMTVIYSLKAAGDYIYPLIVGLITMVLLGTLGGYTYGVLLGFGVAGIYAGTASDECIRGLIVLNHWRRRKWFGKRVVDDAED
ncbi:MAG: MATE family efflux transporter [Clostridiales bacterium]|nr:MATE family efflux transporter [Clostridiales bacterium]